MLSACERISPGRGLAPSPLVARYRWTQDRHRARDLLSLAGSRWPALVDRLSFSASNSFLKQSLEPAARIKCADRSIARHLIFVNVPK